MGVLGLLCIAAVLYHFSQDLPDIKSLQDYKPAIATRILSQEGEILLETGTENRDLVAYADIPKVVIDAFLSAEDSSFFEHQGFDLVAISRAIFKDLKTMRFAQGGSTITQQLAKTLLLSNEKSLVRKIKDLLLAVKLEKKFTKQEILYLYLNQVYLGGGNHGIKTAFRNYFGKDLKQVTPAEAALVAGLLAAPGRYSPHLNPDRAKKRQLYVLEQMYLNGNLSKEDYEKAIKEEVKIVKRDEVAAIRGNIKAGHFTDWIRQRLFDKFGGEKILNRGLTVATPLNWKLQQVAEQAVQKGLREVDRRQGFYGPLKSLKDSEVESYLSELKKSVLLEQSEFFLLTSKGTKKWQFSDQPLLKTLQKDRLYKALVLKVWDTEKIILVDIGGLKGIIPLEHFKWAYKRRVSPQRASYKMTQLPSQIVKANDVVYVKVLNQNQKLSQYLSRSAWLKLTKQEKQSFQHQNLLLLSLEQKPTVQAALVALEVKTGNIVSMVGGSSFYQSQFNRAVQAKRQPGSSYKPFIYAAGLERGYHAASILIDSPQALGSGYNYLNWKPKNYDGKFKGPVTYRVCLEQSRNIPTVTLAEEVGYEGLQEFSRRAGIKAQMPNDPSISLGSFGVSPLMLTSAFALFPNLGKRVYPKSVLSITGRDGTKYPVQDIEEQPPKRNSAVFDPRQAYVMTHILKGVIQRGTAKQAKKVSPYIGGKTGTTSNYIDAWFVGFSPDLVTAVWVGFDHNKSMGYGESGGKTALPIWVEYMQEALKEYPKKDFMMPKGVTKITVSRKTGQRAVKGLTPDSILEVFVQGTGPETATFSADGKSEIYDDSYYSHQN